MEIYATAAMAKVGHALQQQRDMLNRSVAPKPADTPSQQNIYASRQWDVVRADERTRGTANWQAAKEPWKTGMVPEPAYASMFQPLSRDVDTPQQSRQPQQTQQPVRTLAGTNISLENFTHNNMQPYFRGSVRQNVDPDANSALLEHRTGNSDLYQRKQAVECFFEPTTGFAHVCGAPESTQYQRERVATFTRRANDFPIDQVRVGPGIGRGFTSDPDGGFQQGVTLDYVMPKSVDDLRVATNPKLVLDTKDRQGPMRGVSQRGLIGNVEKRRPETYFEQTPDMLIKTTGAVLGNKIQPEPIMKATSRVETHSEYQGGAQQSAYQPGIGESDSYGKENIMVFNNSRDVTGTRTVVGQVTSYVKAIVSPLLDVFKHNHKEYTLDAPRIFGSVQAQIPSKATTYDPVTHKMRTTVREQLDDAPRVFGSMSAQIPSKATTYDPVTHMMRTTVREQLDDAPRVFGSMSAQIPSKATTYDPVNHMMRTTIKEQTIHDTTIANARGRDAPQMETDDEAKTTHRETLPLVDTTVNMSAHTYNVTVYDIDAVAKTTIRQTTPSSSSMYGFMGGKISESTGAYSVIDVNAPLTQKQFVSDFEYQGTSQSKSDFRSMSQEADKNAEIDGTREAINMSAGSTPSAGGNFIGLSKDQIDMEVRRLNSDSITTRETMNKRSTQLSAMPFDACEMTRAVAKELDNPVAARLDSGVLNSLATNPYNININPIK
jgi:hypothetical protein